MLFGPLHLPIPADSPVDLRVCEASGSCNFGHTLYREKSTLQQSRQGGNRRALCLQPLLEIRLDHVAPAPDPDRSGNSPLAARFTAVAGWQPASRAALDSVRSAGLVAFILAPFLLPPFSDVLSLKQFCQRFKFSVRPGHCNSRSGYRWCLPRPSHPSPIWLD